MLGGGNAEVCTLTTRVSGRGTLYLINGMDNGLEGELTMDLKMEWNMQKN